jgi:hypothetical protein
MTHPWTKNYSLYRQILSEPERFILNYLVPNINESEAAFKRRVLLSPSFSIVKNNIEKIKNAFVREFHKILRLGGPVSYHRFVYQTQTMDAFLANNIVSEVLGMGRVAIFVDRSPQDESANRSAKFTNPPYLHYFTAEHINELRYDRNTLVFASLVSWNDAYPTQITLELTPDGVVATHGDSESYILALPEIPLVVIDLGVGLIESVARHQIALLNIESSSTLNVINTNFPIYTEQVDAMQTLADIVKNAETEEVKVGPEDGRRYSKGLERPQFINPSSEPVKASILKENQLISQINEMMGFDAEGNIHILTNLSYLFEAAERKIAELWAMYTSEDPPLIEYPKEFPMIVDTDYITKLFDFVDRIPVRSYKEALLSKISGMLIPGLVIDEELTSLPALETRPKDIYEDLRNGLLSVKTASLLRGYAEDEHVQAREDHIDRLKRIQAAQTSPGAAARGLPDLDPNPDSGKIEKEGKPQRGEGNDPSS